MLIWNVKELLQLPGWIFTIYCGTSSSSSSSGSSSSLCLPRRSPVRVLRQTLSPVSGSLILNFLRLSRPWTRGPLSPAGRGGQPPPRPWGGCCPGAPRPGPRRGGLVTRTPTGTETECRTSSRGSPGDRVLLPTVLVRIGLLRDNWNSSSAALLSVAKCVVVR